VDTHKQPCHLLIFSGKTGLAAFMRNLLTGDAVRFNRRHRRVGHLFQNRYKSVVCEENPYLLELVRYIHLNPLRGSVVKNWEELKNLSMEEKPEYDSRVLGSGEFVQALLRGADEGMARQMRSKPRESLWQSGKKKGQNNFDDFEQRPSFCQGCFECPLEPFFFSSCRC